MSPRQIVVVENSALKRFMKKYGYCVNAAWLAGILEEQLRRAPTVSADAEHICCGGLQVEVKRRNDQWFVTEIEKEGE